MARPSKRNMVKNNGGQKPPLVKIDIHSMRALVDPAIPMLESYLKHHVTRFEEGGPLGYRERQESQDLFNTDFRYRTVITAGQVPRVQQFLIDHGYRVKLTDHRKFTAGFVVDEKYAQGLVGDDRRLVDAVRREPLGQIEVEGFTDMILTMRTIIYLFPKARVLILVSTKTLARKIGWKLNEAALDFDVQLRLRGWPKTSPRCMVTTFTSMNRFRADAWNVILLPDPSGTVGDWNVKAMAGTHDYDNKDSLRVYSFLRPEAQLGRRGRIRLELMSGQVIYRLGPEHVGVRVLWLPTPDSTKIDNDVPMLTYKRMAYWRNRNRNDHVATVARAFADKDAAKLEQYGVRFRDGEAVLRHAPNTEIAVLVASTEQAKEISKRLPEWKVVDAVPNKAGKGTGTGEVDRQGTPGTIITEAAAGKHGLHADVVIRAGGSMGKSCFTGFPPALDSDKRNAILVDFSDGFDERAAQDARRRLREYELLGWESEPVSQETRPRKTK